MDRRAWSITREKCGKLGSVVEAIPEGSNREAITRRVAVCKFMLFFIHILTSLKVLDRLRTPYDARRAKLPRGMCSHRASAAPH